MSIEIAGITYSSPKVTLLHATPLVNAEIAGRTAYDSFANSEHLQVQSFTGEPIEDIESSELMSQLCHVYFHDSVSEHINLTYSISGTSRGVLQEMVRHRIASYTVRSTRYTMSSVINLFVSCMYKGYKPYSKTMFRDEFCKLDMLVTTDPVYNEFEAMCVYDKLCHQHTLLGDAFFKTAVAKSSLKYLTKDLPAHELRELLEAGKKKRNVGDAFKHLVTDNWKVDLVFTMNLRSLKNYVQLRDSGAAYFLIRELAQQVKAVTPKKYLDLIIKPPKTQE